MVKWHGDNGVGTARLTVVMSGEMGAAKPFELSYPAPSVAYARALGDVAINFLVRSIALAAENRNVSMGECELGDASGQITLSVNLRDARLEFTGSADGDAAVDARKHAIAALTKDALEVRDEWRERAKLAIDQYRTMLAYDFPPIMERAIKDPS